MKFVVVALLLLLSLVALPAHADSTYRSLQWNLRAMHVYKAWTVAPTRGAGVKVCSVDTGATLSADIPSIVAGHNTITPGQPGAWQDDQGHGTFTASEIVAHDNQIDGVAPGASLLVVKVLDSTGNGDESSVTAGIFWCVAEHAQVISMSLGGDSSDYDGIAVAVSYACRKHVLFAVSAGNDGLPNPKITPGSLHSPCLIVVNAGDTRTAKTGNPASFSNYDVGPQEVTAPGTVIVGDDLNGGVTTMSGTSMSAPEVAGVMALLLGGGAPASRVPAIILATADHPRGITFPNHTNLLLGSGLIDAYQAALRGRPCTKGIPFCLTRRR